MSIVPTLVEMNERGRAIATAYYEAGFESGFRAGQEREAESLAALQRAAFASVRAVATAGPYAALAERRGEPDRAARQRELLAERGIA